LQLQQLFLVSGLRDDPRLDQVLALRHGREAYSRPAAGDRARDGYAAPVDGEPSARATSRALRRSRRRHYLAEGDWVDSLYKAYITAIIAGLALFYLTVALGRAQVGAGTLATIQGRGAGVIGLGIAVVIALALRSGARGGPLAPEPADVMYLLLAPVSRAAVLRGAAMRQLRGVVLVPAARSPAASPPTVWAERAPNGSPPAPPSGCWSHSPRGVPRWSRPGPG
jgi:hypothetical protein